MKNEDILMYFHLPVSELTVSFTHIGFLATSFSLKTFSLLVIIIIMKDKGKAGRKGEEHGRRKRKRTEQKTGKQEQEPPSSSPLFQLS